MTRNVRHFRLGVFVLASATLLVAALLSLGVAGRFKPKLILVTFFDESVHGLEVGAPVKYRGVEIGSVTAIRLPPLEASYPHVEVEFALPISGDVVLLTEDEIEKKRDDLIGRGLRVRITVTGITGLKYLECDFLDPAKFPLPKLPIAKVPPNYVPSAPSIIKSLENTLQTILERVDSDEMQGIFKGVLMIMERIEAFDSGEVSNHLILLLKDLEGLDLPETGASLRRVLDGIDRILESRDVESILRHTAGIAQKLDESAAAADLEGMLRDGRRAAAALADLSERLADPQGPLEQGLANLTSLSRRLEEVSRSLEAAFKDADIGGTAGSLRASGEEAARTLRAVRAMEDDVKTLIRSFTRTLDRIERLAATLERNPEALIHGKE